MGVMQSKQKLEEAYNSERWTGGFYNFALTVVYTEGMRLSRIWEEIWSLSFYKLQKAWF